MANEMIYQAKLLAKQTDCMGYTVYVFENMNANGCDDKYVMCTQFPNWEQSPIDVGDTGFVSVRFVNAGMDTWFDGNTYVPYKKTDIHFLKFIPGGRPPEDVTLIL